MNPMIVARSKVEHDVSHHRLLALELHRIETQEGRNGVSGALHLLHPRIGVAADARGEHSPIYRAHEAGGHVADGPGAVPEHPAEKVVERPE